MHLEINILEQFFPFKSLITLSEHGLFRNLTTVLRSYSYVAIPVVLLSIPVIILYIRDLDDRLGLHILNDMLTMMVSVDGEITTILVTFFNQLSYPNCMNVDAPKFYLYLLIYDFESN
uniref:G_PROTEIN_RECEP_F1_2 domain-containing protein n=1 Tax=Heterorhabditis bacteriophora TaxID=37862 RepID=A0A1I7WGR2_HETBA